MTKAILAFIEKMSTRIPALSWLGGFILVFLALFDVGSFKSVGVRHPPEWWSLGLGAALLIAGYVLKLLEPSHNETEKTAISGGPLFVLRHYESNRQYLPDTYFSNALFSFNNRDGRLEGNGTELGWMKATQYAVRLLVIMKLLESNAHGNEYRISRHGRDYLGKDATRLEYADVFAFPLVR